MHVIEAFWKVLCEREGTSLRIKPLTLAMPAVALDARRVAEDTGRLVATFPVEDAGYLIGSIYTVMLPASMRSSLGAYYTPPPLVSRLLDLAEKAGFDFAKGSAIDPACGGGAFLAPLAMRMAAKDSKCSPELVVRRLCKRLKGIELDPFAAWMSTVLVEASVLRLCIAAGRRLVNVVAVGDALAPGQTGTFDLVVGNPPYGRVTLDDARRKHYARSLYGHANLYGLFTDLALQLVKPNGVIAYLTPTSFLGGQYFKALRELLTTEASPVAFDFISDREGVFDDVLQETLLTTYIKTRSAAAPLSAVSVIVPKGLNAARIEPVGKVSVAGAGRPWLLPRRGADATFLDAVSKMPARLSDVGYMVSTGQLVWNRHRAQLRNVFEDGSLPLIWAESVTQAGFSFAANRRNHVPFLAVRADQPHLVTRRSCVLVQRTTSKEQSRRLLAAVIPQTFLDQHKGAVVENHLNLVYIAGHSPITPNTIAALLNTEAVDRAFRCISGSVAVSAYELLALPLPSLSQLQELERFISFGANRSAIERKVATFYGVA